MSKILALDPGTERAKLFLGKLCRRGHAHEETGKSMRYISGACVKCQLENAQARRAVKGKEMDQKRVEWAHKNPEKQAGYHAAHRARNKDSLRAKHKEWRKANLQKLAKAMAEYRKQNPERFAQYELKRVRPAGFRETFNAYRRVWAAGNRDKLREYAAKRSGRKLQRLPAGTIKAIGIRQKWKCACCRCDLHQAGYHKDHIVPLVAGGPHIPSNIQLLCPLCNLQKGSKLPEDFM